MATVRKHFVKFQGFVFSKQMHEFLDLRVDSLNADTGAVEWCTLHSKTCIFVSDDHIFQEMVRPYREFVNLYVGVFTFNRSMGSLVGVSGIVAIVAIKTGLEEILSKQSNRFYYNIKPLMGRKKF
ncbi:unnamed protein product [Oppiella nova]|uniref:Uncharacterized protein n=1 Tax=Oppiella nova TaxID=334625 RepID=A0A7R9LA75_9ACAR|nr:unnamed protein product [Oppiella nova]CAG2161395.1 unnamed protein product [Oppiella nova]